MGIEHVTCLLNSNLASQDSCESICRVTGGAVSSVEYGETEIEVRCSHADGVFVVIIRGNENRGLRSLVRVSWRSRPGRQ